MTVEIKKGRFAYHITLKVANMRNEQEFTIYPYNGGDGINLQSGKRFMIVNLKTGKSLINGSNKEGANSATLWANTVAFDFPADALIALQKHLWDNNGKDGGEEGFFSYENKELFSV